MITHAHQALAHGQPTALERALSNLVDNAVKFAPETEPIEIEVRPDRFYRASTARGLPGSGLGLALVRKVARAHSGEVFATRRPGGGAAVGFTLDVSE